MQLRTINKANQDMSQESLNSISYTYFSTSMFIKRSNSWLVAISVLRFSEVGRLLTWLLATQSQTRSRFPSSFPLRTGLGVLNTLFSFFNEKKTYGTSILISITYLINRYTFMHITIILCWIGISIQF